MPDPIINPPVQEPSGYSQAPAPQPARRSHSSGWLAAIIVLLVIAAAGLFVYGRNHNSNTTSSTAPAAVRTATVSIDSQGFTPVTLNVPANTTVTWTSKDAGPHIVASNNYPKDDILPGLKSQQLGQNARYSYDFKKPGTYPYHDDLHPDVNGTIVVK